MTQAWLASAVLCWLSAAIAQAPDSAPAASAAASTVLPPLADCVAALRRDLPEQSQPGGLADGVRADSFDRLTQHVQDLRPTIDTAIQTQPEFVLPIWDYLTRRVDGERIGDGRGVMREHAAALAAVEARLGVDGPTTVAVLGIETDYGRVTARYPVIDATLSRACLRPDSNDRRRQFYAALWLAQEGYVDPADFRGSWAGAFGLTQFMPATFRATLDPADPVKPDILHSVPNALATTARYLKQLKWTVGLPWGLEVRAPRTLVERANAVEAEHGCAVAGRPAGKCRGVGDWLDAGVTPVDGGGLTHWQAQWPQLARHTPAALFAPSGPDGPVWLVTGNYHALWQYNRADAYALAIGLLSDHLRGAAPMRTPWPTDDPGLSRAEVRELQALLHGRGACDVKPDGRDGPRTADAVRAVEAEQGWAPTGRAGRRVLEHLRQSTAAAAAGSAPSAAACSEPAA